ncbi:putative leucine-rich repeat-containing protein DDB_G0290503 isoform X2 [Clytia hemisphaerica]|uniref:Uncharacterized protein n=1 Tax=Clytia hemisphaerica TaxID=252671 RepID=A0A7M5U7I0_9CNID
MVELAFSSKLTKMSIERNCKFFSPNYFNPTKCQNCYKPKEQHSEHEEEKSSTGKVSSMRKSQTARNTPPSKTLLKESVLFKACLEKENTLPEIWDKSFFRLYSNGELQEFAIIDNLADKESIKNTLLLQDFIRMLDGKKEIGETLCFGVKTLRSIIYFKTLTKVDYENWWKEFSSFVAAPVMKRTQSISTYPSTSTGSFTRASNYTKPNLTKQMSLPQTSFLPSVPLASMRSPMRSSRSSSASSATIPEIDNTEMEQLRNQVSRLEEENSKLSKSEESRRKLELEVNYWKEYVTNAQQLKRSGGSVDTAQEMADTRRKMIEAQDEVNETQKRLKLNSGKILMQNRELNDTKQKLTEANSLVAVYKAKIENMAKELMTKHNAQKASKEAAGGGSGAKESPLSASTEEIFYSPKPARAATQAGSTEGSTAQYLEDKFLVLKDKMKRIEKELFLKSKELEKANESRSKVAKYTRSLLQELETRLSDTQTKLNDSEDKLKNATTELKMERERRIQSEEGPRRRMSSIASPPKSDMFKDPISPYVDQDESQESTASEFTEHDADTKYADYYRSRYKEAEEALLEKDMKLHQAEEKIKQIQNSMKSSSDSHKVINELQTKLSDATHKLSDRQLKIHELTREIDRLKGYEKTFEKKVQQCSTLEEIVKDLESTNSEQSKSLHQTKQEVEILKIREVVLKEQLQTLLEEGSDDESDAEDSIQLHKSVALKNQISNMVELEAQVKKLTLDNDKVARKNVELELRLRNANIQHFKALEQGKHNLGAIDEDTEGYQARIKDLETKLVAAEDRYLHEMSNMKEKHYKEISGIEKDFKEKSSQMTALVDNLRKEKEGLSTLTEDECNELRGSVTMLNFKLSDLEDKLRIENEAHLKTKGTLDERVNLFAELETRCKEVTMERDNLKAERRDSYGVYEEDDKMTILDSENDELKMKVRKLERELRVALDKYQDLVNNVNNKEKSGHSESKEKDRDSGIVITQEIKNLMDAYKDEEGVEIDVSDYNVANLMDNLSAGITGTDDADKYKKLCINLVRQLKELGNRFIVGEERSLQLAEQLEQKQNSEEEYVSNYNGLLNRIEDLNQQIIDSQEVLQSKADELELERKNVLNLVEVTSAYIKELEGSLVEYKTKVQDLQNAAGDGSRRGSTRPQPEGSSGQDDEKSPSTSTTSTGEQGDEKDHTDGAFISRPKEVEQVEDMKILQGILSAKVMTMETDMVELEEKHAEEVAELRKQLDLASSSGGDNSKKRKPSESETDTEDHEGDYIEELLDKIDSLEDEITEQKECYDKDISTITERFQSELKAAFSGDTGSMDMLNRVQDLEIEIEDTRKDRDAKIKEITELCEKEKQQMKDDMATVLQAGLAASMGGDLSTPSTTARSSVGESADDENVGTFDELQDRVIQLEQELIDVQERYEEQLEMEKEAHQTEMEDTIRDMMMVRAMSNSQRHDSGGSELVDDESSGDSSGVSTNDNNNNSKSPSVDLGTKKKIYTSEEVENIKQIYERKIETKENEHQDQLDQVRQDMAFVVTSLNQGSSSDTIIDLQAKIKEMEHTLEDVRADCDKELEKMQGTLKKTESKNFFHLRRNEEMGAKIYQMQNEIEEMDRKHSLEVQIYQERLAAIGGGTDIDSKATDVLRQNAELEDQVSALQLQLNTLRNERETEFDTAAMQVCEEKQEAIREMTDKVLKLEAIIDDMKESHDREIQNYEKQQRDTRLESNEKEQKRIEELEQNIAENKQTYEQEISELSNEHKRVVEELRVFYEKEIGEMKNKRSASDVTDIGSPSSRKPSTDQSVSVKQVTKELKEKYEKELSNLHNKFEKEKDLLREQQEREISDIRTQYDEKLKMGYKEGLRRQSVSERRSDGARIKELVTQKEAAESKYIECELKYEKEVKSLESRNTKLQNLVSELKSRLGSDVADSPSRKGSLDTLTETKNVTSTLEEDEAQKKLKEIQEQIERYERRIEYYREKSQREKTEESHRVSELQSEIVELHKEVNSIEETLRKQEQKKRERAPGDRIGMRRNTDGSLATRRHTDTEAALKTVRPRDPKKRWSNLEERSEKEEGKSGTVSARKSMWESIQPSDQPASTQTSLASKSKSLPRGMAANIR